MSKRIEGMVAFGIILLLMAFIAWQIADVNGKYCNSPETCVR